MIAPLITLSADPTDRPDRRWPQQIGQWRWTPGLGFFRDGDTLLYYWGQWSQEDAPLGPYELRHWDPSKADGLHSYGEWTVVTNPEVSMSFPVEFQTMLEVSHDQS